MKIRVALLCLSASLAASGPLFANAAVGATEPVPCPDVCVRTEAQIKAFQSLRIELGTVSSTYVHSSAKEPDTSDSSIWEFRGVNLRLTKNWGITEESNLQTSFSFTKANVEQKNVKNESEIIRDAEMINANLRYRKDLPSQSVIEWFLGDKTNAKLYGVVGGGFLVPLESRVDRDFLSSFLVGVGIRSEDASGDVPSYHFEIFPGYDERFDTEIRPLQGELGARFPFPKFVGLINVDWSADAANGADDFRLFLGVETGVEELFSGIRGLTQ